MSRSQSDGEQDNQGRVLDPAERASLGAFLTPPPKARASVVPPSVRPGAPGVPRAGAETVQGPRPFWEAPVLRTPKSAFPQAKPEAQPPPSGSGPPSSQGASVLASLDAGWIDPGEPLPESVRSEPLPAPPPPPVPVRVAAAPPVPAPPAPAPVEVAPAPAQSALPAPAAPSVPPAPVAAQSVGPTAPAVTPSTLAPSAYDTVVRRDDADSPADLAESETLEGAGVARPFLRSSTTRAVLAAAAAVILIGGLALRGRRNPSPAAGARPEPATAVAPAANLPTPPDPAEEQTVATELTADPVSASELQRRARELLVTGQIVEGVAFARRAIAAAPNDGENYILLAAGLQDLGRWDEARTIFSQCMRRSGGPASAECVYFATTGK
jgi:hypothetical protein